MDYEEEAYFGRRRYDDFHYDNDVYSERHGHHENHCHRCGCHPNHRWRGCHCDCHSHGAHRVCRELEMILRDRKNPWKPGCGCAGSIQDLTASNKRMITSFILVTRSGQLYAEWGRHQHHHSFATVFFSVVKVNCRPNEAVLELLKPNRPITNPRTREVERRRIKDVDYVVPTGERVYVDLTPIREVQRLPKNFVKRYR